MCFTRIAELAVTMKNHEYRVDNDNQPTIPLFPGAGVITMLKEVAQLLFVPTLQQIEWGCGCELEKNQTNSKCNRGVKANYTMAGGRPKLEGGGFGSNCHPQFQT